MTEPFAGMLRGGHPNSLGRTGEVVESVLVDHARLRELFAAISEPDAVLRMRAADALEKVCRRQPGWIAAHADRLLGTVAAVEQPSVQWHIAQILHHLRSHLSGDQSQQATKVLQRNLTTSTDWIVLNVTMDVLAEWARHDPSLAAWLMPELERLRQDKRKSVAKRASKRLAGLVTAP